MPQNGFYIFTWFKTSNEQYFVEKWKNYMRFQMSVSLKLYWNTAATICLNIIYDFLCAQTVQLRSAGQKAVCGSHIALPAHVL